jgi:uncharacterized protein (UPF0128 family)
MWGNKMKKDVLYYLEKAYEQTIKDIKRINDLFEVMHPTFNAAKPKDARFLANRALKYGKMYNHMQLNEQKAVIDIARIDLANIIWQEKRRRGIE